MVAEQCLLCLLSPLRTHTTTGWIQVLFCSPGSSGAGGRSGWRCWSDCCDPTSVISELSVQSTAPEESSCNINTLKANVFEISFYTYLLHLPSKLNSELKSTCGYCCMKEWERRHLHNYSAQCQTCWMPHSWSCCEINQEILSLEAELKQEK